MEEIQKHTWSLEARVVPFYVQVGRNIAKVRLLSLGFTPNLPANAFSLATIQKAPPENTLLIFLKTFDAVKQVMISIPPIRVSAGATIDSLIPIITKQPGHSLNPSVPWKLFEVRCTCINRMQVNNCRHRSSRVVISFPCYQD